MNKKKARMTCKKQRMKSVGKKKNQVKIHYIINEKNENKYK